MAQFFITRPVFAWVLAIITMLAGAMSAITLPIEQYPDIAPTRINVTANYPGASAEVTENSVTTPLEDAMTGLEGMLFMTSTSSSTGRSQISITFDESIDPNMAQIEVQNKVARAEGGLPEVVRQRGISVSRSGDSALLVGALVSLDGRYSTLALGDMTTQLIENAVLRTEGVGAVDSFSSGYAMRIWLNPLQMAHYGLIPSDVTSAIAEQNTTVSVGSLGAQPVVEGQQLSVSLSAQTQLSSVDEFAQILLKVENDGAQVLLSDVAEVEIGQERYGNTALFNGANAAGFSVSLASGANAVKTAQAVRAVLDDIASALPEGVTIAFPYDTSPFIEESIATVYKTLAEAVVLVFLVILVFLQSWRATIIPVIAIPVVLLGTFGMLSVLGYSINTLTMFAMVLAIGLLVDDAIVVVENVERVMEEDGVGPLEATRKSMTEISSALVGIVLVLSAVFLPMAFMSGSTGVIYRQFSVTIITAMVLSLGVALTLTPAMCASLLKARHHGDGNRFARAFNRGFEALTLKYGWLSGKAIRRPVMVIVLLFAISAGAVQLFRVLPSSFVPQEDQGVMMVIMRLAEGSTTAQTADVAAEVENWLLTEKGNGVTSVMTALGFGFGGTGGQNTALLYVRLKPFDERPGISAASLVQDGTQRYRGHRAGSIIFTQPPAIQGMGSNAGVSFYLIDQAGQGQAALEQAAATLAALAEAENTASGWRGHEPSQRPALSLEIDQRKARAMGIPVQEVNNMLSVIFSGREVNDFALGGELRPVVVQGAARFRMQPEEVEMWHARNKAGEMVPFSAFMNQVWSENSPSLNRFGGTRAISLSATPAADVSTGEAMTRIEELVQEVPGAWGVGWIGMSYQEKQAGNQAPLLFAMSALVVFLSLAALYESWSVPFAVMLAVPVGIMGALAAAWTFGQSNDVYFKVGLLTTIGLAARNAILIVEFAEALLAKGRPLMEATVEAAMLRLRPIVMTSFAFALGVLPLAIATGAGSAAQHAIGIGVLGGMMASAVIAIVMVPALYVAVKRVTMRKDKPSESA